MIETEFAAIDVPFQTMQIPLAPNARGPHNHVPEGPDFSEMCGHSFVVHIMKAARVDEKGGEDVLHEAHAVATVEVPNKVV